MVTDCRNCPLRGRKVFEPFTSEELEFMRSFKSGELVVESRTTILLQGSTSPQLFTALSGWGVRYKLLEDGRRQVINFVMPGDLVGLQAGLLGEMQHCVQSVTRMTLCVFSRADLWALFKAAPRRAYDITWLAAREEHFLGDMLATIGQTTGLERVAWGLLTFYRRAAKLELTSGPRVPMPYRQQDLADAFGLSLVHTNKTLRKLREMGLVEIAGEVMTMRDLAGLEKVARMDPPLESQRPLI